MWRTSDTAQGGHSPLSDPGWTDPPASGHGERDEPRDAAANEAKGRLRTPDLVGMAAQDARRTLRLSDLRVLVEERPAGDGLRGHVLSQHPEPGAPIEPGDMVTVLVGSKPLVAVPDVRGREEDEALQRLRGAGLVPNRRVMRRSDRVPQGHVIRTRPRAGAEVPAGTRVTYVVAAMPRPQASRRHHEVHQSRAQRMPDGTIAIAPWEHERRD